MARGCDTIWRAISALSPPPPPSPTILCHLRIAHATMESNEAAAPIDLSYLCVSPQFPFNDNDVLAEWAKHEAGLPASSASAPSTTRPSTSSPSDSSPPNGANTLSPAQRRKHAHSEVEKERRRSITNGFTVSTGGPAGGEIVDLAPHSRHSKPC